MATITYTSGGSDSDYIWYNWTDSGTSDSTSSAIWSVWANATSTSTANYATNPIVYHPETEEQRLQRQERERERRERWDREQEKVRSERELAKRRAVELLCEHLDDEQHEQFKKTQWFYVIGQSGKRYRVRRDWSGNVDELNEDNLVVAHYCIHPRINVPTEDSMLIQKLMLETNEVRFKEIANRTEIGIPYPIAA